MYYWFRPPIHLCETADDDRALCGAEITGRSPTVRPLPEGAAAGQYFAEHDAEVCSNCRRLAESRAE
jgi:hypothetical protein